MATAVRTMRPPVKLLSQKEEASMARYFCRVLAMMLRCTVPSSSSTRSRCDRLESSS